MRSAPGSRSSSLVRVMAGRPTAVRSSRLPISRRLPLRPSPSPTVLPFPPGVSHGLGWPAVVLGLLVGVAGIALALSLGGRSGRTHGRPALGSVETEGSDEQPAEPPADPADRPGPNR